MPCCAYLLLSLCTSFTEDHNKYAITEDSAQQLRFTSSHGVQFRCVYIPPGEFEMGDREGYVSNKLLRGVMTVVGHGSAKPSNAGPVRKTKITRGYYILDTKVTAEAYCEFLNEVKVDKTPWLVVEFPFLGGFSVVHRREDQYVPNNKLERAPIRTATWHGANAYCEWLSKKLGRKVRLPTEAEWEYCAKGAAGREYPWGQTLEKGVDYGYHIDGKIALAGAHPANATPQKVYDMIGPTAEWCSDLYQRKYDLKDTTDPQGPKRNDDESRVLRGRRQETTHREYNLPNGSADGIYGFRFVVEAM